MPDDSSVLTTLRHELGSDHRIGIESDPIDIQIQAGAITLAGEVNSVAAKKLALQRASAVSNGHDIIDNLLVRAAKDMTDGEILDAVAHALLEESALSEVRLRQVARTEVETLRDLPGSGPSEIILQVTDGVVELSGNLTSHEHRRLAGVLAWWVPGTRDVRNAIVLKPAEEDNDAQLTDAIRLVLEKDPFVTAEQIKIFSRRGVVKLEGLVSPDAEQHMAEADAWFVDGVSDVINEIVSDSSVGS